MIETAAGMRYASTLTGPKLKAKLPIHRFAFGRDEAKSAQERLRESRDYAESLIETMRDPFLVLDNELHIVSANQAFYRSFAVTPAETLGRLVYDIGNRQWNIPALRDLLENILPGKKVFQDFEVVHHFEQIGDKIMLLDARHIVREGQDTELILLAIEDVTESKRMEADLRRSTKHLLEADRRKNEFLAMLAHELRNPLAPVRNGLEILNRLSTQDETSHQVRVMMERQVDHMSRLLEDWLDISRISSGKIELQKDWVELTDVVSQSMETYSSMLEAAGQELKLRLSKEPLVLRADRVRLAQIIENLMTNAIKHSDPCGEIEVDVEREGSEAVLKVHDAGIGISVEMLPRIWDLFVQAEPQSGRSRVGLGIGLTVAQNLVRLHGGSIEVHSPGLGQGCEFTVRLPLAKENPNITEDKIDTKGLFILHPSRRIMIVDDNIDEAESLGTLLRLMGNDVRVFNDGPTALEATSNFQPEVAFLDIGMPTMDGYELARALRRELSEQPLLIAVTGYGMAEDRRRSREAGFDAHLVKPAAAAALQALLNKNNETIR